MFHHVGTISSHERVPIANTATHGTRFFAIRRHMRQPGTAPSREKANIIRDADVTDAVRQNIWATTAMKSKISAQCVLIDVCQMYVTMLPPAAIAPAFAFATVLPGIANVTPSRRTKPKITDTTTDMYMPTAAPRDASCVSSAMCADASKPVIVYWAIRRPIPKTYQNMMLPKLWPWNPELLIVCPKT